MNYLKEINSFENWLETNPISDTSQLLWYKLMCINNKCGWMTWFDLANTTLVAKMNIRSEKTLINARNKLAEKGLIKYKSSGNRKKAGKYHIISFESDSSTVKNTVETAVENSSTVKNTVVGEVVSAVESAVESGVLNKLNKTKLNNKEKYIKENDKPLKTKFAEFVMMSEIEHENLIKQFGQADTAEKIEKLNLYKGSTGKKYASDYLTILSWERRDKTQSKASPIYMTAWERKKKILEES